MPCTTDILSFKLCQLHQGFYHKLILTESRLAFCECPKALNELDQLTQNHIYLTTTASPGIGLTMFEPPEDFHIYLLCSLSQGAYDYPYTIPRWTELRRMIYWSVCCNIEDESDEPELSVAEDDFDFNNWYVIYLVPILIVPIFLRICLPKDVFKWLVIQMEPVKGVLTI